MDLEKEAAAALAEVRQKEEAAKADRDAKAAALAAEEERNLRLFELQIQASFGDDLYNKLAWLPAFVHTEGPYAGRFEHAFAVSPEALEDDRKRFKVMNHTTAGAVIVFFPKAVLEPGKPANAFSSLDSIRPKVLAAIGLYLERAGAGADQADI